MQRGAYLKRKPVSALDDDYDRLFPATASSQKASGTSAISDHTQKLQMIQMREAAGSTTISAPPGNPAISITSGKVDRSQRLKDGECSDYFQRTKEKTQRVTMP